MVYLVKFVIIALFVYLVSAVPHVGRREVGGHLTRTFPDDMSRDQNVEGRAEREVGGLISRRQPVRRDIAEEEGVWTLVQTDEENMTMDRLRGKVPLSLTEEYRGIMPILPP